MKKALLLFVIAVLLSVTCSKEISFSPIEKTLTSHPRLILRDNTVSINDLMQRIRGEFPQSKTNLSEEYDIIPYLNNENSDTLLFIVNSKSHNGWKIYSTDKRTPAILAEGETGYFSLEEGSPAVAVWIDCMAKDISRVKESSDDELAFSPEEIAANRNSWLLPEPVRGHDDTITPLPAGHWEEVGVYTSTEEYDTVGHLTAHWDQGAPYNACCPFLIDHPGRADVGCVAVAGSQLLYYLHEKLGYPEYMFANGYCNGYINGFEKYFWNYSDTTWSAMSFGYQGSSSIMIPEAVLLSYAGKVLEMHYCEAFDQVFSWAYPENLKNDFFSSFGITCSSAEYNETVVKSSLLSQMPVIVAATDQAIPINFRIHCFVIDGYRRTRTKITHHFRYYYDEPVPGPPFPCPPEYYTYTYGAPIISSIRINWGWWTQWQTPPVNEGWYSLTGGWTVINNGNTYDYNHNRWMIYGFSVQDN